MQKKHGFTLIELLVAVTIMGLLVGSGIAAYRRFNDKQTVVAAGAEMVQLMRAAQKQAKAGEKPESGCGRLVGYRVEYSGSLATVSRLCEGQVPELDLSKEFGERGVTFADAGQVDFGVLAGGATVATIRLGSAQYSYEIAVDESGSISGGMVTE